MTRSCTKEHCSTNRREGTDVCSRDVTHKSLTVENTKKDVFTIDLTGQTEGVELSPGDSQSVAYSITNTGTVKMYAFVRLNTNVAPSGDPSVYSFAPGGG